MTFGDDTRAALQEAKTLPAALTILIDAFGGLDHLGAELGTSRQAVSAWRKNGRFPVKYAPQLRALGVPDGLLRRSTPAELERRLRAVEAEIQALREMLP